jgi:hypothetical protein
MPPLAFIRRVADTTTVSAVTEEYVREGQVHREKRQSVGVQIVGA